MLKLKPVAEAQGRPELRKLSQVHSSHFHFARGVSAHILAYELDSLVRVSRRDKYHHWQHQRTFWRQLVPKPFRTVRLDWRVNQQCFIRNINLSPDGISETYHEGRNLQMHKPLCLHPIIVDALKLPTSLPEDNWYNRMIQQRHSLLP